MLSSRLRSRRIFSFGMWPTNFWHHCHCVTTKGLMSLFCNTTLQTPLSSRVSQSQTVPFYQPSLSKTGWGGSHIKTPQPIKHILSSMHAWKNSNEHNHFYFVPIILFCSISVAVCLVTVLNPLLCLLHSCMVGSSFITCNPTALNIKLILQRVVIVAVLHIVCVGVS